MKALWMAGVMSVCVAVCGWGDSMDPPGPPGSPEATMKPLNQIDPGEPILSIPCVLTNSGSYYLISNLVGKASNDGIRISTNDVRIDLRGFALIGVVNSWDGIWATAAFTGITVENGSFRGWGMSGVALELASGVEVRSVKSCDNQGRGFYIGDNAGLRDCLALNNRNYGIQLGENGSVVNCAASGNTLAGMYLADGGRILGCTSSQNKKDGIVVENYGTIRDCTTAGNTTDGIQVLGHSRVIDNNSSGNGVDDGTGAGIHLTGSGSRVQDNNVTGNDYGIWADDNVTNLIIRNSASGNTTDYNLGEMSVYGEILDRLPGGFTIGGPWVNFKY